MSGIYECNGDELHGDGREVHEPDSSPDQGKPDVCPKCGSDDPKKRGPRIIGGYECFDMYHSSPVPAAATKPSQEEYDQLIFHNCAGICSCEECRNYRDKYASAPQAESVRYLLTDECNRQDHSNCPRSNDCRCTCHPSVPAGKDAAELELPEDIVAEIDYKDSQIKALQAETAALRAERDKALDILWRDIDDVRDPKLSLVQVAIKAANAIYWRNLDKVKLESENKELETKNKLIEKLWDKS